jgi:hypothetical protein
MTGAARTVGPGGAVVSTGSTAEGWCQIVTVTSATEPTAATTLLSTG